MAGGSDSFVVISGDAQGGSQFFIELAQVHQLALVRREFFLVVGKQEFLIARIPQQCELTLQHDAGNFSHLKTIAGCLAQFRAAIVLLDSHDSAGATDEKSLGRQRFHLRLSE